MKDRLPGIFVALLVTMIFGMQPVWSQDSTQPSAQEAVKPEKSPETIPPAAQDTAQPEMPQETAPTSAQDTAQSAIQLLQAVVCQDVVERTPVGSGDVFAKEVPRVYCFTQVTGAAEGSQITHNWYYQGGLKASVKLNVRSSSYRTWSSKTMMPEWTGEWMVEILSPDGKPLESIIFFLK